MWNSAGESVKLNYLYSEEFASAIIKQLCS